jgi:hypothetical protein
MLLSASAFKASLFVVIKITVKNNQKALTSGMAMEQIVGQRGYSERIWANVWNADTKISSIFFSLFFY